MSKKHFPPATTGDETTNDTTSDDATSVASTVVPNTKSTYNLNTANGPTPILTVIRENLRPACTVALVSITLSIALGIASGSTPVAGLSTAIWGGIICGVLSDSNYNIIGPAGALAGMLSTYSSLWGPDILPWISLFSSIFCALAYILKLYRYVLIMPTSVFEGFTVAVALIIGFKQMNSALGLHPHHKHGHFFPDVYESFAALDTAEWGPCVMFFLVVLLLFPLMKKFPSVPWMVLIPVVTILFGWLSSEGLLGAWDLPTLKTKYGALQPDIIIMLKPEPLSAAFANGDIFGLIIAAGSVAFVAILETLISAKIAGFRLDKDFDQAVETRGITAAHAVCGLLGAMPPTGVFVRTSINVSLGATHRISQFINAVIVLLITVVAMPLFSFLPLSCIAAVLVVSAGRMVPKAYLRMLWKEDRGSFWLCILTAFLCCAIDPVVGLLCGMLVAFMGNSRRNQNAPNMFVECSEAASGDCTITLNGPVTYVTAETMLTAFKKVAKRDDVQSIMVNLESVTTVDVDGLSSLEKMDKCLGQAKKRANFGPKQHAEALIGRSTFFQLLVEEGRITYQPLEMPGGGKTKEGVLAGAEEGARQ